MLQGAGSAPGSSTRYAQCSWPCSECTESCHPGCPSHADQRYSCASVPASDNSDNEWAQLIFRVGQNASTADQAFFLRRRTALAVRPPAEGRHISPCPTPSCRSGGQLQRCAARHCGALPGTAPGSTGWTGRIGMITLARETAPESRHRLSGPALRGGTDHPQDDGIPSSSSGRLHSAPSPGRAGLPTPLLWHDRRGRPGRSSCRTASSHSGSRRTDAR